MPTLREELAKHIDEAEAAEESAGQESAPAAETAPEEPSAAPEESPEPVEGDGEKGEAERPAGERSRDESGRFAKDGKTPKAKAAPAGKEPEKPAPAAPATKPEDAAAAAKSAQAPASAAPGKGPLKPTNWRPLALEKWDALPPEVKAEALRVDNEVRGVLRDNAAHRKTMEAVQQTLQPHMSMLQGEGGPLVAVGSLLRTIQPFESMIRAEGAEPVRAVGDLLRTAHALRYGPVQGKAQLVANIVRTHNIPVEALAEALDGKGPVAAAPQGAPTQPVFDPNVIARQVREQVQADLQRAELQRLQTSTRSEVDAFLGQQEFGDSVRDTMADLLEIRARAGKPMTLADAYKEALQMHPETAAVLRQRAEAEAAKAKAAATQRARAASSSIRTRPAGAPPTPKPNGLRGTLEAAWDAAEER